MPKQPPRRALSGFRKILLALLLVLPPAAGPLAAQREERSLTLYTALTATTPQIPLWAAIGAGWPDGGELSVQYWKSLDDLRGLILAGKGDIWVGHLEGFAQAALRGAPITLVAVTGWRKFYFVYSGDGRDSLEDAAAALRREGMPLAVAPQDSPALGLLKELAARGGADFSLEPMPPQQALLAMIRGSRRCALLPEPLVSALLAKKPDLRVIAGLEGELARLSGGSPRLPLAGVAVRTSLVKENPELIRELARRMRQAAEDLSGASPEKALAVLPSSVRAAFDPGVLETSLSRDLILAVPAAEARREILAFLCLVLPESFPPEGAEAKLPESFFFRENP
ncbi:MAG: hypothetical protein LBJ82_04525 [Deltaproteobacteria bacterium]|jgi:NitT/TauT family transport system substrate-binding protein|nr:hypothetical protein [Deltaproteobacteria bacterium]